jgi:chromosome segregation ATPase
MKLEASINDLNRDYFTVLDAITSQTEKNLSENELKDLRARIAAMQGELEEKGALIKRVNTEKETLDSSLSRLEKIKAQSLGQSDGDIKTQTRELNRLNDKYRLALQDKIEQYNRYVEALKVLVER